MKRLAVALALPLLLTVGGCGGSSGTPAAASAGSPVTSPTTSAAASSTPPSPVADPISFGDRGRGCVWDSLGKTYAYAETIRVTRPLTFGAFTPAGPDLAGLRISKPLYAPLTGRQGRASGSWLGSMPPRSDWGDLNWAGRAPLTGVRVLPGRYNLFWTAQPVDTRAGWTSWQLTWVDADGATGSSTYHDRTRFNVHC